MRGKKILAKINCVKGMTLIEVTISISLISLLALITSRFLVQGLKVYRLNQQRITIEERAARVMREFEFSTRAATQIVTASDNELSFYRYYDLSSPEPTLVRYFIEGSQFKVGRTQPVGAEPDITYPPENEIIDFLVDDLSGTQPLFTYYEGSGNQLSQPVSISSVRMIGLSITLDKSPTLPPASITESTVVQLRNMKENL